MARRQRGSRGTRSEDMSYNWMDYRDRDDSLKLPRTPITVHRWSHGMTEYPYNGKLLNQTNLKCKKNIYCCIS